MVSKKINICWRSLFVITWPESLTVREKITSQVLHNKNSRINPWSSSFALHIYILVDYFLSYIFFHLSNHLLCCILNVEDELARYYFKTMWQCFFKYNSADFRQNAFSIVYAKAKHLRQLTKISKPTTNQELEEKTFCLKSNS